MALHASNHRKEQGRWWYDAKVRALIFHPFQPGVRGRWQLGLADPRERGQRRVGKVLLQLSPDPRDKTQVARFRVPYAQPGKDPQNPQGPLCPQGCIGGCEIRL